MDVVVSYMPASINVGLLGIRVLGASFAPKNEVNLILWNNNNIMASTM